MKTARIAMTLLLLTVAGCAGLGTTGGTNSPGRRAAAPQTIVRYHVAGFGAAKAGDYLAAPVAMDEFFGSGTNTVAGATGSFDSPLATVFHRGRVFSLVPPTKPWAPFDLLVDPYPFILLNLVLSCLAAFQAPIIMMSQNRQEAKDRLRAEHYYQVNLKAELEIRHLHWKMDQLLRHQWQRLLDIQQIQLDVSWRSWSTSGAAVSPADNPPSRAAARPGAAGRTGCREATAATLRWHRPKGWAMAMLSWATRCEPVDFGKVLSVLVGFFEREGFRYAAIGAFGLHALGLSRATLDLDLATESAAQPKLVAFLESLGYETLHRSEGYSNHLHPDPDPGRGRRRVCDETSRLLFGGGTRLRLGGHEVPVPRP